jgi:HAD superfamily hydrolase (TIGR01549 family)
MAHLTFGDLAFDADLVVFDKDGTLIEFAHMWGQRIHAALDALCVALDADIILRGRLYMALGYDPERQAFVQQSPAITAPMSVMYCIPAVVLYQHGYGWLEAELLVETHYKPMMDRPLAVDEISPTTDLARLFTDLRQAGVGIAVVTSDDRAPTIQTLAQLGLTDLVGFLACADDDLPNKPAPDGLLAACRHFGVDPARVAMVGDSTTDMVMAQRAQVGLRVGVLTGVMRADLLEPVAHVVLPHVGVIQPAQPTKDN